MYLPSKIFKNPSYQQIFERDGVIKMPFLDEAALKQLKEDWLAIQSAGHIKPDEKYHVTLLSTDTLYKKKISELLYPLFDRFQKEILNEYRVLTTNLIVKHAHSGEVPVHQNWTFVDEQKYTSLTIWCPLQDIHTENGALYFLKGSHQVFRDVYRGPQTPYFFIKYEKEIKAQLEPIYLKAGEALIFDDSILHYSPDNNSSEDRVAVQGNLIPVDAEIFYHEFKQGFFRNTIHKIKIKEEKYLHDADWEKIKEQQPGSSLPELNIDRAEFFKRIKKIHA